MQRLKPVMLRILDGWGKRTADEGNAVSLGGSPVPGRQLATSGQTVALPDGIMVNSEVGHLNIGAGQIVNQDLMGIDMATDFRAHIDVRPCRHFM